MAVGAIVLMPLCVITATYLVNLSKTNANPKYGFIPIYVLALALGGWGLTLAVSRLNFFSGLLVGAAGGLLGLTALCNAFIS